MTRMTGDRADSAPEEPQHPLEQAGLAEPRRQAVGSRRRGCVGGLGRELRDDRRRGRAGPPRRPAPATSGSSRLARPRSASAIGRYGRPAVPMSRHSPTSTNAPPAAARRGGLADEPRLADAGLAAHDDEPRRRVGGRLERPLEDREVIVPVDQRRARDPCLHGSGIVRRAQAGATGGAGRSRMASSTGLRDRRRGQGGAAGGSGTEPPATTRTIRASR